MKHNTLSGESSIKGSAPENTDMSVPPAAVQKPDSPLLLSCEHQDRDIKEIEHHGIGKLGFLTGVCSECGKAVQRDYTRPWKDWEPEQAWGTPWDFREHVQRGGTLEDY